MERLQKSAVLCQLAEELRDHGSWCGETHIQKSTYLLQDLLGVPLGLEYILYKHGPYSFDLAAELTAMRADFLLEKEYVSEGYGARLMPTKVSGEFRSKFKITLAKFAPQIEFVANTVGKKGVAELEKLATAFYVTRELPPGEGVEKRAERIHSLKPHIPIPEAMDAVREFDGIALKAASLGREKIPGM